jgi:hypothetical protein
VPALPPYINRSPSGSSFVTSCPNSQVECQTLEELFFQGHRLLLLEWNCFMNR